MWENLSHEAVELYYHITSDSKCYHANLLPFYRNFERKIKRGIYDSEGAKFALFSYALTRAAHSYIAEHCDHSTKWNQMFSVKDRRELAAYLESCFKNEIDLGNSYA
jgi:hypothetical protein